MWRQEGVRGTWHAVDYEMVLRAIPWGASISVWLMEHDKIKMSRMFCIKKTMKTDYWMSRTGRLTSEVLPSVTI